MFKTIVLFSDGTGNSSASPFKTNVFRLYDALDMTPEKGQIAYYDDGVGSSQHRWLAAVTGAFGIGMKRNVLDLYKFLTRHYAHAIAKLRDPETGKIPEARKDEVPRIACFGFSRGAFTMRVLVGLVDSEGLPVDADSEEELDRLARCAYRKMRADHFKTLLRLENLWRWPRDHIVTPLLDGWLKRRPYDRERNIKVEKIDFLGLWDTVGAYGMPVEELRVVIDKFIFPLTFSSYDLLDYVTVARHALSIDDERDAFTPIPFDDALARRQAKEQRAARAAALMAAGRTPEEAAAKAFEEVCERSRQVWFAGVHANVGGGYPDDSQAFLPLRWLMREAMKQGVAFRDAVVTDVSAKATAFGQLYDSRSGLNALYRYKPRDVAGVLESARRLTQRVQKDTPAADAAGEGPATPLIHESVIHRMALRFDGYAPIALPARMNVVDDEGRTLYEVAPGKSGAFLAPAQARPATPLEVGLNDAIATLRAPDGKLAKLVEAAVFWRRVMYQVTLWSLILLLLTPLLDKDSSAADNPLAYAFSSVAGFASGYLPGFLSPWLESFVQHPLVAGTLIAIFLVSFWWGGHLRKVIADRSRMSWGMAEPRERNWLERFWDGVAWILTSSETACAGWRFVSNRLLPATLLVLAAAVAVFGADRLAFHLRAFQGDVCRSSGARVPEGATRLTFETNNPCFATGLALEKGRSYLATFTIGQDWRDASLAANLGGLKRNELSFPEKAAMFLVGLAARRIIDEPWFKPMLQIGTDGFAVIPANPDPPFPSGSDKRKMTVRFKAPKAGELFIYVNDAYSGFVPTALLAGQSAFNADGSWLHFYGNNAGTAEITLEALPTEYGD